MGSKAGEGEGSRAPRAVSLRSLSPPLSQAVGGAGRSHHEALPSTWDETQQRYIKPRTRAPKMGISHMDQKLGRKNKQTTNQRIHTVESRGKIKLIINSRCSSLVTDLCPAGNPQGLAPTTSWTKTGAGLAGLGSSRSPPALPGPCTRPLCLRARLAASPLLEFPAWHTQKPAWGFGWWGWFFFFFP